MLEGKVPTHGVFGDETLVAIIGNNKLCGGILHLSHDPSLGPKKLEAPPFPCSNFRLGRKTAAP
jgi:hypothetical protein